LVRGNSCVILAYLRKLGTTPARRRLSAIRPPLDSGERSNGAKPGRKTCAAGTRYVLFDIVSCAVTHARPHPEERACRRRSAKSNARARVSKDEDERLGLPSCFETTSAVEAPALASHCDAAQHEGEGARRILAKRTHILAKRSQAGTCVVGAGERPTCGCTK
jgi:hypothetical protein